MKSHFMLPFALLLAANACVSPAENDDPPGWGLAPGSVRTNEASLVLGLTGDQPRVLAADATDVYWASQYSEIWRIPKAGGYKEKFASTEEAGGQYVEGIVMDDDFVYWTELTSGTVRKRSKAGGPVTILASGRNRPWGIALDRERVYWTDQGDNSVNAKPKTGAVCAIDKRGGSPILLASEQQHPTAIALDDDGVYFANGPWGDKNGSVNRVPKAGGALQVLAERQSTILHIAASAGVAYFVEDRTPIYSYTRGALVRASIGSPPAVLDPDVRLGGPLALSGPRILYASRDPDTIAEIRAVAVDGTSKPDLIAWRAYPKHTTVNGVAAIAADSSHAYWCDFWWNNQDARRGTLFVAPLAEGTK